jgi:hypothetical protein
LLWNPNVLAHFLWISLSVGTIFAVSQFLSQFFAFLQGELRLFGFFP